ncbi:MAG: hypothetical protein AVDCRST_MAG22-2791 [uncultured Rubrobacteraceae bacterium]|uniref:Uncharacterized protein n=1 Tax=uncultured Rubrobacteraceae bacterium TaxID=349277 RepID=A0A6J4PUB9_9ACTN|nr:MAG: hypothetical protein AVDCRST_MAG22-2791 [uncultured Rubrobacteraceae bacterium]
MERTGGEGMVPPTRKAVVARFFTIDGTSLVSAYVAALCTLRTVCYFLAQQRG